MGKDRHSRLSSPVTNQHPRPPRPKVEHQLPYSVETWASVPRKRPLGTSSSSAVPSHRCALPRTPRLTVQRVSATWSLSLPMMQPRQLRASMDRRLREEHADSTYQAPEDQAAVEVDVEVVETEVASVEVVDASESALP